MAEFYLDNGDILNTKDVKHWHWKSRFETQNHNATGKGPLTYYEYIQILMRDNSIREIYSGFYNIIHRIFLSEKYGDKD